MGVAFFLSVLGLFLGSFQQPGPTTSHLQLFPALAVSVISAPMVSLSSTLRAVSCPLPSTAAAISAILFSCYQLSLWRWERPLMRTLLFLYFHYTRNCAGGCVLARECAVRILALIMADFMQRKIAFVGTNSNPKMSQSLMQMKDRLRTSPRSSMGRRCCPRVVGRNSNRYMKSSLRFVVAKSLEQMVWNSHGWATCVLAASSRSCCVVFSSIHWVFKKAGHPGWTADCPPLQEAKH